MKVKAGICGVCGEPAFVNVTMSLLGRAGIYCLKHANEYSGLIFTPPAKGFWREVTPSCEQFVEFK